MHSGELVRRAPDKVAVRPVWKIRGQRRQAQGRTRNVCAQIWSTFHSGVLIASRRPSCSIATALKLPYVSDGPPCTSLRGVLSQYAVNTCDAGWFVVMSSLNR